MNKNSGIIKAVAVVVIASWLSWVSYTCASAMVRELRLQNLAGMIQEVDAKVTAIVKYLNIPVKDL